MITYAPSKPLFVSNFMRIIPMVHRPPAWTNEMNKKNEINEMNERNEMIEMNKMTEMNERPRS